MIISILSSIVSIIVECPVTFVLTVTSLLLVYWCRMISKVPEGMPPGYSSILGFIQEFFLPLFVYGKQPEDAHMASVKKYGKIFRSGTVPFNWDLAVNINDYDSIRKAFIDHGDVFAGRTREFGLRLDDLDSKSILSTEGAFWREHRRFALTTMRDFGVGKTSIEPRLLDEITYFLHAAEDKQGELFDISELLGMSLCNNMCVLEFGRRFEYTDPRFLELKHYLTENLKLLGPHFMKKMLPGLKYIPFIDKILKIDQRLHMLKEIDKFLQEQIQEHEKNYKEGSKNDYIDAYFTERRERQQGDNPESAVTFDDAALFVNLGLFFNAGTETTLSTLRWAFFYMLQHPDIQRKVQKEIDDVIGRDRLPSYNDRSSLPYTEAVILEVHRRGSVVALNIPHRTTEDVHLNGFFIPSGSPISTNLWAVHHDPQLFPDPMTFRPERYINEQGVTVKPDHIIPFSLGKRFCLGEPLARVEIFLYFTCILQRFSLVPEEGVALTTVKPPFTNACMQYKMRCILRE